MMEGKALLFKHLAKINAVEVNTSHSAAVIDTIDCIADTFGGIHMEGMAESKSLEIEQALIAKCPSIFPYFYPFLIDVPPPFSDHGQSG
ncbi:hypothetical protein [Pseudomonas nunensis]|uniref:Uncharacterized protein n=1 Tax=Pseudomonas nunensis TaxID=2961896 RepID=A0ABY5EPR7_9PSED|nr:hypothetical protein [Pseudomonas nunensis]MCL5225440.1 hypothetical protein [Pseudomonas nunensis]UTO16800.1 hypothetical protein NK667_10765 [Pseudomonas nunensis]